MRADRWAGICFLLALPVLMGGCFSTSRQYSRVDFCWTSDHRVPPQDRFAKLDLPVERVTGLVLEWITNRNGQVTQLDTNPRKIISLTDVADESFHKANSIAEAHWNAYRNNVIREVTPEEWRELQRCTTNQVKQSTSTVDGCVIVARLEDRTGSAAQSEAVRDGQSLGAAVMPSVLIIAPSVMTVPTASGMIGAPGAVIPLILPTQYKHTNIELTTFSKLEFQIFQQGKQTILYARGVPVDATTNIEPAFGNAIGYAWWSFIDASIEADLVNEALNSIREAARKIAKE